MKKLFFVILVFAVKSNLTAQITIIPDYRFERALIDLGIDSDQTINGQILTNDALLVTTLNLSPNTIPNYPYPADNFYDGLIQDLTGIEAFVNIEHLVVNTTMIDHLNLNNLIQLKYLDCVDNMLTSINVSNNPLLEYINVTCEGDLYPINDDTFKIKDIELLPINVMHYKLPVKAFRIKNFCYITDANYIEDIEKEKIKGSEIIVINALRKEEHISHFTFQQAIDLIKELNPRHTF